jgi:hypothetical protein
MRQEDKAEWQRKGDITLSLHYFHTPFVILQHVSAAYANHHQVETQENRKRNVYVEVEAFSLEFNPLRTKRICFIQGLSAYRAVNTLHFGYKNQSLNVL